ncbi:MAG: TatD family hydrolase [Cyclobacteriaceae bacterium]|jgi:TatD DNase family protein|tara:strand:- start:701 stop:1468 length:768 start_codon:yes stop_codon:yes gene_type:complete
MLIETHAHLYSKDFDEDVNQVILRAKEAGIEKILMPNIDSQSIEPMLGLETAYPNFCLPMIGLHPCSVTSNYEDELARVSFWLKKRKFIAIGEIGTDLYWDKTFWPEQQKAFLQQCQWALDYDLPIAIHSRASIAETIDLIRPYVLKGLKGVFHCFSGSIAQAAEIKNLGFYLGIGGVLTFKNGGLNELMAEIGIDHVILETDSPYLAPKPFRGKRNEPAYLTHIVRELSLCLDMNISEISQITSQHAKTLFRLK